MTFIEKIKQKQADLYSARQITIAFIGDSVTHGCFELYGETTGGFGVIYDGDAVYHNRIRQTLNMLYPSVPFNIINAGINGDSAPRGFDRLERDVLGYKPDLTVVCYGLNDCGGGEKGIDAYTGALSGIFDRLTEADSAVIFMTPNMIGTKTLPGIADETIRRIAGQICTPETGRNADMYIDAARSLCGKKRIPVCDCYAIWKGMESAGVDVTSLLCNYINHPRRELHEMFAYELLKLMLGGSV